MPTSVQVSTTTYATTFVANNLLRSVKRLVLGVGLTGDVLANQWEVLERGVAKWLDTRHLEKLVLEIYTKGSAPPAGFVDRFDFTIDYGYYPNGDGELWLDSDSVAYAIRKRGVLPGNCTYRVVATTRSERPDVAGWSNTTLRSTAGYTQQYLDTSITGGSLGAGLATWKKAT